LRKRTADKRSPASRVDLLAAIVSSSGPHDEFPIPLPRLDGVSAGFCRRLFTILLRKLRAHRRRRRRRRRHHHRSLRKFIGLEHEEAVLSLSSSVDSSTGHGLLAAAPGPRVATNGEVLSSIWHWCQIYIPNGADKTSFLPFVLFFSSFLFLCYYYQYVCFKSKLLYARNGQERKMKKKNYVCNSASSGLFDIFFMKKQR
jgi:hypothetical protein